MQDSESNPGFAARDDRLENDGPGFPALNRHANHVGSAMWEIASLAWYCQTNPGHFGTSVRALNAASIETSASPLVIAVAAMIRSKGSRCSYPIMAARKLASGDTSTKRPPCSSAKAIRRSRNGAISGHLSIRTF
jgi:hypothetical protein